MIPKVDKFWGKLYCPAPPLPINFFGWLAKVMVAIKTVFLFNSYKPKSLFNIHFCARKVSTFLGYFNVAETENKLSFFNRL